MTTITYFWLKPKIHLDEVAAMGNNEPTHTIGSFSINSCGHVNPTIF